MLLVIGYYWKKPLIVLTSEVNPTNLLLLTDSQILKNYTCKADTFVEHEFFLLFYPMIKVIIDSWLQYKESTLEIFYNCGNEYFINNIHAEVMAKRRDVILA